MFSYGSNACMETSAPLITDICSIQPTLRSDAAWNHSYTLVW